MNRYEKLAAALIEHLPACTLEQILANIDESPEIPATLIPTCLRLGSSLKRSLAWSGSPEKLAKIQTLAQRAKKYTRSIFNLELAAKKCDPELNKLIRWICENGQHSASAIRPEDCTDQDVIEFIRCYQTA